MTTAAELAIRYRSEGIEQVQRDSRQASTGIDKFSQRASAMGSTLTRRATIPLLAAAGGAVKLAADLDTTFNTMEAVAGITAKQRESLEALALTLGKETVFSANEAANAQLELAKAGISVADIQGGALKNTLALATAGNLELTEASTIAANAMNTFNLSGSQSQRVADALAGAANASSADVSDLAMALTQGGNAAATMGLSVEESAAALAAFADQGIKGSDAGTSLKTMLLNLNPPTAKAAELQRELGLEFFDAQGNAKGLTGIASELEDSFAGLSQQQRVAALRTLFGTDAFRAANIVLSEGESGMRKYIAATSDTGSAARVGEKRMSGFAGTFEEFKGSVETAGLVLGQELLPVAKDLLDDYVIPAVNWFADLNDEQKRWVVLIGAGAAAAGPLLKIVSPLGRGLGVLSRGFRNSCGPAQCLGGAMAPMPGTAGKIGGGFRSWAGTLGRTVGPMLAVEEGLRLFKNIEERGVIGGLAEQVTGYGAALDKVLPGDQKSKLAGALAPIFEAQKAEKNLEGLTSALEKFGGPLDDATRKIVDSYVEAGHYNSAIELLENRLRDATKAYTPALKKIHETNKEVLDGRDVVDLKTRSVGALSDSLRKNEREQGRTRNALRNTSGEFDRTTGKADALRRGIQSIPSRKSVEVKADLSSAYNAVSGFLDYIANDIGAAITLTGNVRPGPAPRKVPAAAAGAFVARPTLMKVGEGGEPEGVAPFSKFERLIRESVGNRPGSGSLRLVEGKLSIDENGEAWIRGLAIEEDEAEDEFRASLATMRGA